MSRTARRWLSIPSLCVYVHLFWLAGITAAQEEDAPTRPAAVGDVETMARPAFNLWTTDHLLGDPGGLRSALEDAGLKYTFILGSATSVNFRGGENTHSTLNNGARMFYIFEADLEKMGFIPGGSVYVRMVQEWGDGPAGDVGTKSHPYWLIASSGEVSFDFDKWWYKQRLFDGRLEFRLGKLLNVVDLIDVNAYAANYLNQFSNQALNYNLTIPAVRSLGAYVRVEPTDWLYALAMAADTDFSQTTCSHGFNGFDTAFGGDAHFLGYWEVGAKAKLQSAHGDLPGNYRLGWWYNPRSKDVFRDTLDGLRAAKQTSGDVGYYVNFDQAVWKENEDPKDHQGLGVFARYGYAHGEMNAINHFWSVGASYLGPLPGRDKDVLGFGMAQSIMSKDLRREVNELADRETVYQLYYAMSVTPWCVISPDLQVVTNPGGDKDARDAFIGGVRVKIDF